MRAVAADGVTNDPDRQIRLMQLAERATLSAAELAIGVPADRLSFGCSRNTSADELASGLAAISARR